MSPIRTTLRRAGLVAALAAAGVLTAAGVAFAHVTVHPESYAKGATDGVLTFRVPNEEDTANTTKVQVFLPTDHPVLGVLVTPQDGWTAKVTTTRLKTPVKTDDGTITDAVSEITWTGGRIRHGEYQDFNVAFGQLAGRHRSVGLQDAADLLGRQCRPLDRGDADRAGRSRRTRRRCSSSPPRPRAIRERRVIDSRSPSEPTGRRGDSSSDSTARGLGIAGLVAGVLGLVAAGVAIARGRSARSS